MPVFGSNYRCVQLFSLMNIKSESGMCLTDEYLERCMQIAATEIKPDIERLLKQKQSNISLMTDFVKENYCELVYNCQLGALLINCHEVDCPNS
jgi:hypothetical protein